MKLRFVIGLAMAFGGVLAPRLAAAASHGPYVVLRDDGTLTGKLTDVQSVLDGLAGLYDKSGAERPDIVSVWTSYDMDNNKIETLFAPEYNDIKGINADRLPAKSGHPPIRAFLLHNNVLKLDERAQAQNTPTEAFSDYLFLLELMHVWGPNINVPAGDGGAPDELIGFSYHWSFWLDAGGSPAGGNCWNDNGDGTFTVLPQSPSDLTYSMLDLYLMGLADPSEVTPFGVLENAVPPADAVDPFTKRKYSASSFPWFQTTPFTATATRRQLTIDDVIAANGARVPARASSPSTFKLGIALVVPKNAKDVDVAAAEAKMDEVSVRLAPAFARATGGRGTLSVVTKPFSDPEPDGGVADDDAGASGDAPPPASTSSSGGCATVPSSSSVPAGAALAALVFAGYLASRRRAPRR